MLDLNIAVHSVTTPSGEAVMSQVAFISRKPSIAQEVCLAQTEASCFPSGEDTYFDCRFRAKVLLNFAQAAGALNVRSTVATVVFFNEQKELLATYPQQYGAPDLGYTKANDATKNWLTASIDNRNIGASFYRICLHSVTGELDLFTSTQ